MNGVRPVHHDASHGEKKKRNYKLLVDPAMKKGAVKVYRYDGVVPGVRTQCPPIEDTALFHDWALSVELLLPAHELPLAVGAPWQYSLFGAIQRC